MYRLFWLYVFFGVPVYAAPVIPNFQQGVLQQHVETKQTIVEDVEKNPTKALDKCNSLMEVCIYRISHHLCIYIYIASNLT